MHDTDSPVGLLQLSVTSANQTVLPNAKINVQFSFAFTPTAEFYLTVTPAQAGSTTLILIAKDDSHSQSTQTISLSVVANNITPTISTIADRTGKVGVPLTLNFTVSDADNDLLTVIGESSQGSSTFTLEPISKPHTCASR